MVLDRKDPDKKKTERERKIEEWRKKDNKSWLFFQKRQKMQNKNSNLIKKKRIHKTRTNDIKAMEAKEQEK